MTDSIKILCVEDSVNVQQMLSFILTKAGYTPYIANNGQEAIEKTKTLQPDLILMDIMMPDLSGIQAIKHLKSDPASQHIPILVLSAYTSSKLVNQAMEAGAAQYLEKTIIPEELVKVIASYLESSQPLKAKNAASV
jgi:CheY-like chemotaxis protein